MGTDQDQHQYDDIINLPHHVSVRHPRMSSRERAAQFAPFAALTGYEDMIEETARYVPRKPELSEEQKADLDRKLEELNEALNRGIREDSLSEGIPARLDVFVPDRLKDGGCTREMAVFVKRVDYPGKRLILADRAEIPLEDILGMDLQPADEDGDGMEAP
ncbi:MAG: hypothetical protein ACOX8B_01730 [Lachnospiraceae bacterium]|jgi:hypothetical protein